MPSATQAGDAHPAAPVDAWFGGDGAAQHPFDREASAAEQDEVVVAGARLAVLDVGREDPLDAEFGGALLEQCVEHVGRTLAQDPAQPGEDRVRLPGVGSATPIPVVEGLVGGVGHVGVVALVHGDPVPVARQQQREQHAGHATSDDGDVLGIVDAWSGGHGGVAHDRLPRKSMSASLTSAGRSCWVQWPQPSRMIERCSLRQGPLEGGDRRRAPDGGAVAVAADEQRRHVDPCSAERGEVLPVAVDVAVAVERAAQPAVLELARVHVEVGVGEPGGHRVGAAEAVLHAGARGIVAIVPFDEIGRRGVARAAEHEAEQPVAHVGLDLGLGPARLLEVLDVELLVAGHRPHRGGRPHLATAGRTAPTARPPR